jgi:hypothetical protein
VKGVFSLNDFLGQDISGAARQPFFTWGNTIGNQPRRVTADKGDTRE